MKRYALRKKDWLLLLATAGVILLVAAMTISLIAIFNHSDGDCKAKGGTLYRKTSGKQYVCIKGGEVVK